MPEKPTLVPRALLQRIFPKECLGLVDSSHRGTPDFLLIEGINILVPFSMPKTINLGKYSAENVEKYGTVTIDGIKMKLSAETIVSNVFLAFEKDIFSLEDVLQGKAAGKQIPMGGPIKILVKLTSFEGLRLVPGMHQINLAFAFGEGDPIQLTFDRMLKQERMHLDLA